MPFVYVVCSTLLEKKKQIACSFARAWTVFPDASPGCGAKEKEVPLARYTASLCSTSQVTVVTWGLCDDLPKNITPHGILASSCLTLLHQTEPPASCLGFSTLRWPCSSSLPGSLAMVHPLSQSGPTVSSCDLSAQWTQCVLGSISLC